MRLSGRQRIPSLLQQRLEAVQIELPRRDPQQIAVRPRQQDAVVALVSVSRRRLALEQPAQPRDERVNALGRTRRRRFGPELVDDLLDRNDLVRAQQEQRQQSALLAPAERQGAFPVVHLERAEYPEVHGAPLFVLLELVRGRTSPGPN